MFPGIVTSIGTGIEGGVAVEAAAGAAAAVEVGTDMNETSTIGVRGITIVAGAAVQVLTQIETVGEANMMMMSTAVGAGRMIGMKWCVAFFL